MSKFPSIWRRKYLNRGLKKRALFFKYINKVNQDFELVSDSYKLKAIDKYNFFRDNAHKGYSWFVGFWETGNSEYLKRLYKEMDSTRAVSHYHSCFYGSGIPKRILEQLS